MIVAIDSLKTIKQFDKTKELKLENIIRLFSSYPGVECILKDLIDTEQFDRVSSAVNNNTVVVQDKRDLCFVINSEQEKLVREVLAEMTAEEWQCYADLKSDEERKQKFCDVINKKITMELGRIGEKKELVNKEQVLIEEQMQIIHNRQFQLTLLSTNEKNCLDHLLTNNSTPEKMATRISDPVLGSCGKGCCI
ncbi:MAG: hypothetical protein HRK26_02220 [Rickettsiaceae bacterium H1]|nr:hypothetical protein [Rickettsiaceae bacterium H1]